MTTTNAQTRAMIKRNIWYLRKGKGYTQQTFSAEFNITRSALGSYEEGRAEPPMYLIINICKIFGLDIGDFVTKNLHLKS